MNASASALALKPAPHQLAITRGAVYVLELALQDMGPCTSAAKMAAVGRLWEYLQDQNDRLIKVSYHEQPLDFEKPWPEADSENELEKRERLIEKAAAIEAWMDEPFTLELTDKRRDLAREIFKWVIEHQGQGAGKATTRLGRTKNLNRLIYALGLAEAEPDTQDEE